MCVPVAEQLMQLGDCCEWFILECGQGVFQCRRDKIKSMNDAIPFCDSGLGKIIMHKIHHVREEEGFGGGVDYVEAALVIESGADVEAFVEMEVPSLVSVGIVVDENWASHRDDVHYIVVERSMVVIPGRH